MYAVQQGCGLSAPQGCYHALCITAKVQRHFWLDQAWYFILKYDLHHAGRFCNLIPLVGKHPAITFLLLENKTINLFCFFFFSVLLHCSFWARRSEATGAALWGGAGRERVDGSHSPSQVGVISRFGWGSSWLPVLLEDFVTVRWYHLGPFLFMCEVIVCPFHGCVPVKDKKSRHKH